MEKVKHSIGIILLLILITYVCTWKGTQEVKAVFAQEGSNDEKDDELKMVALTFDDGPHAKYRKIIRWIKRKRDKSYFFFDRREYRRKRRISKAYVRRGTFDRKSYILSYTANKSEYRGGMYRNLEDKHDYL